MYETVYQASLILFIATPVLLLILRLRNPKKFKWWIILLLTSVCSWLYTNIAVHSYHEHLSTLINSQTNPAPELVERWASDGGKIVFALFFGWLYGLVYLGLLLFIYGPMAYFINAKREYA